MNLLRAAPFGAWPARAGGLDGGTLQAAFGHYLGLNAAAAGSSPAPVRGPGEFDLGPYGPTDRTAAARPERCHDRPTATCRPVLAAGEDQCQGRPERRQARFFAATEVAAERMQFAGGLAADCPVAGTTGVRLTDPGLLRKGPMGRASRPRHNGGGLWPGGVPQPRPARH